MVGCALAACEGRLSPPPVAPSIGDVIVSTNFSATENPLSEGGKWINGKAAGLDWLNVQTTSGKAFASAFVGGVSDYNDNIAVLTGTFTADQFAQGTVSRVAGYSPRASHEVELLLRFSIFAHDAHGYEVLWAHTGEINVVRWNGPLGNYTPLAGEGGVAVGAAVDGDVLRAEISGNVIRVWKNGSLVLAVDVRNQGGTVWSSGQPGLGFWPRSGATLESYGWKSYQAGNL